MTEAAKRVLLVSHEDWLRIGEELFGSAALWLFRCVSCEHEQSIADVLERNDSLRGKPIDWIASSCEGRVTKGHGCDWTLGGLFQIHTLELFYEGRRVPTFRFAHERADELLEAAAKAFTLPAPFTTDATCWEDFPWPDWVPQSVREEVERFWGIPNGRAPRQWADDARRQRAPAMFERVTLRRVCSRGATATGRYVHAWNNIGRIVQDDGEVACVSF